MVARNFPVQDVSYSQLLQDNDREFIIELKPSGYQQLPPQHSYQPIYYELPNMIENEQPCSSNSQSYQQNPIDSNGTEMLMDIDIHHQQHSHSIENLNTLNNDPMMNRKRKSSHHDASSDLDDETDTKSVKTNDENKKQNHSEIEKRRRDKMNTYITELSSMVPMCHAMSRKLDKLTVLRMAVQHLKTIRGAVNLYPDGQYNKPSFLSEQELKTLILQAADGFLFVVGCDRGRILYISESVTKYLNYCQGDLLGQSLFDILHPKDIAKVKEQLSSSDLNPRERLIDAKTMLPVKTDVPQTATRFCPGARRSFFCRMKCKIGQIKEEADTTTGCHRRKHKQNKKFNVIQCTGYLKSWAPAKMGITEPDEQDSSSLSCLVAVGRILPHISTVAVAQSQSQPNVKPIQFISRHALDGKFLYVDQRATLVLGYLPQELLGSSMYEYYHHDDIHFIAECHKCALQSTDKVMTKVYRFKTKDGGFIKLQSEWKSFRNPWTKEIENLISKNNLIWTDFRMVDSSAARPEGLQQDFDFLSSGKEMQRMINNHVEASKIGRQIAEQVMDSQKRETTCIIVPETEQEVNLPIATTEVQVNNRQACIYNSHISTSIQTPQTVNAMAERDFNNHCSTSVNNNSVMNDPVLAIDVGEDSIRAIMGNVGSTPVNEPSANDGNDEAAMAVLMSLLEADAGLGEPVDFSGLPWPLS